MTMKMTDEQKAMAKNLLALVAAGCIAIAAFLGGDIKDEVCGFAGPSDHIGAINIASRAAVSQPIVATCV